MSVHNTIERQIKRAVGQGNKPTQVMMSTKTRGHLADELRRMPSTWEPSDGVDGAKKRKYTTPPPRYDIVPTQIYGVHIVIMESVPDDSCFLSFDPLREEIDYKTGKKLYVVDSSRG